VRVTRRHDDDVARRSLVRISICAETARVTGGKKKIKTDGARKKLKKESRKERKRERERDGFSISVAFDDRCELARVQNTPELAEWRTHGSAVCPCASRNNASSSRRFLSSG